MTKWSSGDVKTKWSRLASPTGTKWATLKRSRVQPVDIAAVPAVFKGAVVLKTKTRGNLVEWYNTGVRYEQGSGIL